MSILIGWDHLNRTWSLHPDYTALFVSTHRMSLKEKGEMEHDNLGSSGANLMPINHTNTQIKTREENPI